MMEEWRTFKQEEWLSLLATQHKITDWQKLEDAPHYIHLKRICDPEILFPGDRLYIPGPQETGGTQSREAPRLRRNHRQLPPALRFTVFP